MSSLSAVMSVDVSKRPQSVGVYRPAALHTESDQHCCRQIGPTTETLRVISTAADRLDPPTAETLRVIRTAADRLDPPTAETLRVIRTAADRLDPPTTETLRVISTAADRLDLPQRH